MSSKNVSLREDVYRALKNEKGPDESFSDVVERLLEARDGDHPLYGLVGLLDETAVERVRDGSDALREGVDERMEPGS